MRPTPYDAAGGEQAFLRLARAMTARCLADPELNHAFSHGGHPEHDERLAAYWGEVLGGPPTYTTGHGGDQTQMVRMHAGNHAPDDWDDRFVACFDASLDDAGLPDDPELRHVLHDYLVWAAADTSRYQESVDDVPNGLSVPRWSWDGLVSP